jgi:hypothetical protein
MRASVVLRFACCAVACHLRMSPSQHATHDGSVCACKVVEHDMQQAALVAQVTSRALLPRLGCGRIKLAGATAGMCCQAYVHAAFTNFELLCGILFRENEL